MNQISKNHQGNFHEVGTSPNTIRRTWSERWQIVKDYYKATTKKRKNLNSKQRNKWRRWLMKEAAKADKSTNEHYRSKAALKKRIKSKWWAFNHRYSDNKNKRRNAVKTFILKQASYQELYRIQEWITKRKQILLEKSRQTRLHHRVRAKALKSKQKQNKNYLDNK